jgi:tRNA nucleotidyltransferase (CCA-adding enzyme)
MITGKDILDLGFREGPLVGDIMSALKMARLDGIIVTREDEIKFIQDKYVDRKGE